MSISHDDLRAGSRYSSVSIALHWALAALLIVQIAIGLWFDDQPWNSGARAEAFALHASVGATILLLSLARLIWRIANPAPPSPYRYSLPIRLLSRATHVGMYVVMIGMPLSGWALASVEGDPLPAIWGVIPFPMLPISGEQAEKVGELVHNTILLYGFYALLFLHVAGALKHHLLDRDITLWRMLPLAKPLRSRS